MNHKDFFLTPIIVAVSMMAIIPLIAASFLIIIIIYGIFIIMSAMFGCYMVKTKYPLVPRSAGLITSIFHSFMWSYSISFLMFIGSFVSPFLFSTERNTPVDTLIGQSIVFFFDSFIVIFSSSQIAKSEVAATNIFLARAGTAALGSIAYSLNTSISKFGLSDIGNIILNFYESKINLIVQLIDLTRQSRDVIINSLMQNILATKGNLFELCDIVSLALLLYSLFLVCFGIFKEDERIPLWNSELEDDEAVTKAVAIFIAHLILVIIIVSSTTPLSSIRVLMQQYPVLESLSFVICAALSAWLAVSLWKIRPKRWDN